MVNEMPSKDSDLKTVRKSYELDSYAKKRNEAISDCFSKLRKKIYLDIKGALINMQVINVKILEEKEETRVEKLFGYFMPRERRDYYIKLEIDCEIKYL